MITYIYIHITYIQLYDISWLQFQSDTATEECAICLGNSCSESGQRESWSSWAVIVHQKMARCCGHFFTKNFGDFTMKNGGYE